MNIKNLLKNLAQKVKALEYKLGLIADYVVEIGTDGTWTYEKWESGKAVCRGVQQVSVTAGSRIDTNSYLYTMNSYDISLPSGLFTSVIFAGANAWEVNTTTWGVWLGVYATTTTLTINPLAWTTGSVRTHILQMEVVGKWQ